ncbi:uncharacterized protein A4U43_C07F15520 [Asparagus officinalis]|uniref:Uncharacterized protein n=1 Tax=Asparagus officinalis TaxID=4686 RepID=A0A5P1ECD3_ASPOF|nr:uncharacterized protein A4U43_C07F15520 [Asparagus officinalis]
MGVDTGHGGATGDVRARHADHGARRRARSSDSSLAGATMVIPKSDDEARASDFEYFHRLSMSVRIALSGNAIGGDDILFKYSILRSKGMV